MNTNVIPTGPQALTFADHDRTFTCAVSPRHARDTTLWWWFTVTGAGVNPSRYAPFVAMTDDTVQSVQERIVAYYDDHVARRNAPAVPRWRRATS